MTNFSTILSDPSSATSAATWCKRRKIDYKLEFWGWPQNTKYKFIFNNDKDLVMFSLKWV
jgi:hypothetical protein